MFADPEQFIVEDVQHGWHVQAWFGFAEGVPWIAELRIRPADGRTLAAVHRPDGPLPEPLPNYPHDPARRVPPGGITTTVLRSLSPMALYDAIGKSDEDAFTLSLHGRSLDEDFLSLRRRPGRPGRDAAFYAMWAARYLAKCAETRRPFPELAKQYPEYPEKSIRNIVHAARERSLLRGGSQGRAGGVLSRKAERLLATTEGDKQ